MADFEQAGRQAAPWTEVLAAGERVHTVRSRSTLIVLLVMSAGLCAALLWGGGAQIALVVLLPFIWLHYLFAEVQFREDRFEYRDWMLQPRRRRVEYWSVAALARSPTDGRGRSPGLSYCHSPSGRGDDLKWVCLSTDWWIEGLAEAVRDEVIRRCGLSESSPVGGDGVILHRPGERRELPALPTAGR